MWPVQPLCAKTTTRCPPWCWDKNRDTSPFSTCEGLRCCGPAENMEPSPSSRDMENGEASLFLRCSLSGLPVIGVPSDQICPPVRFSPRSPRRLRFLLRRFLTCCSSQAREECPSPVRTDRSAAQPRQTRGASAAGFPAAKPAGGEGSPSPSCTAATAGFAAWRPARRDHDRPGEPLPAPADGHIAAYATLNAHRRKRSFSRIRRYFGPFAQGWLAPDPGASPHLAGAGLSPDSANPPPKSPAARPVLFIGLLL